MVGYRVKQKGAYVVFVVVVFMSPSVGQCSYIQNELVVSLGSYGDVDAQTAPNFAHLNNIGLGLVP